MDDTICRLHRCTWCGAILRSRDDLSLIETLDLVLVDVCRDVASDAIVVVFSTICALFTACSYTDSQYAFILVATVSRRHSLRDAQAVVMDFLFNGS